MNIQTDRALIPAGKATVRYLTVAVTAPARERRAPRAAVEAAFVLDRSGSMAGRKIEMAKKAVDHAVRLLHEDDRLAVVCYDTEIDTLLGATKATAEAKQLARKRLSPIDARGGTDLCAGWLRGASELTDGAPDEAAGAETTLRRVLLLSDGQANEGETRPDALAGHARALRAKGIATSTFGIGADFDETLMSRLATEGGGHFYFIEQAAQIPDFLASELGEALEVVAREARLVIAGGPGVEIGCLNDFPVERSPRSNDGGEDVHVRLGDLVSAQALTVVIAVRCPAGVPGDTAAVTVRLADRDHALFPLPMPVEWRVVDEATDVAQAVNSEVIVEVATLIAECARTAALDANRRGDFSQATAILKAAATELRALGSGIRQVEALAAELEANQEDFSLAIAPLAIKARHFAAYSVAHSRSAGGKARKGA